MSLASYQAAPPRDTAGRQYAGQNAKCKKHFRLIWLRLEFRLQAAVLES